MDNTRQQTPLELAYADLANILGNEIAGKILLRREFEALRLSSEQSGRDATSEVVL